MIDSGRAGDGGTRVVCRGVGQDVRQNQQMCVTVGSGGGKRR